MIVEVFDIDDAVNQTIHDSIDFYGRTLLDLKLYRSIEVAQLHRVHLRSLFGTYTNLTADFSVRFCIAFIDRFSFHFSSIVHRIITEMNVKHSVDRMNNVISAIEIRDRKFVNMDISVKIV